MKKKSAYYVIEARNDGEKITMKKIAFVKNEVEGDDIIRKRLDELKNSATSYREGDGIIKIDLPDAIKGGYGWWIDET